MSSVSPIRQPAPRATTTRKRPSLARSVVGQWRTACQRSNRLATCLGMVLGGFVPVCTYVLSHYELTADDWLTDPRTLIVLGGLLYSAKTVYRWGQLAFADRWKAAGFVLLTEGVMVLSQTPWLAFADLVVIVAINGVGTAVTLSALDSRE